MSLAAAADLARGAPGATQLVVARGGETLLDLALGCRPDALFRTFSAGKPVTALVVHALAERSMLDLDEPMALTWPELARHGKADLTARHVLRHRSGFATGGTAWGDALAMDRWDAMVRRAERAPVRRPPGSAPAYQFLLFGFLLGELARRRTGRTLPDLADDLVLAPAGLRDTFLGIPREHLGRAVPVVGTGVPGPVVAAALNRRSSLTAVNPSAGVASTARDLAMLYAALLEPGRVLRAPTLAAALAPSSDGVSDLHAHAPIRWSEGFQLGGPRWEPGRDSPLGATSSPSTFGHHGSRAALAWADPELGAVMAWVGDRPSRPGWLTRLSDLVLAGLRC